MEGTKDVKEKKIKEDEYLVPFISLKQQRRRKIFGIIKFFLPIVLILTVFNVVLLIGIIPSSSMNPIIGKSDLIIVNRLAYAKSSPQRGDIIVFKKGKTISVKRVIGIGGDTIELKDGYVYLNGTILDEDYTMDGSFTLPLADGNSQSLFAVPEGSLFVLGDNRENSSDSRYWGDPYVKINAIYGKVISILSFKHGIKLVKDKTLTAKALDIDALETSPDETGVYKETTAPEIETTAGEGVVIQTLPANIE